MEIKGHIKYPVLESIGAALTAEIHTANDGLILIYISDALKAAYVMLFIAN